MRLTNKITIKGDTLSIFESIQQYNNLKVGDMVTIEDSIPSNIISKAGLQPKTSYEIKSFINQGNNSVLAVFDPGLARKTNYMQGVFNIKYLKNTEVSEGSFNPMKGKKMYFHVLEDGGYGRIGHQGYYNTPEEAQKRADELSDMFPKSEFYVEAYPTKKEPVTVTMESNVVNEETSDNSVDRFIKAIELYKVAARSGANDSELSNIFKGGKLTSAFIFNSTKNYISENNYNTLVKMFGKAKVDNLVNAVLAVLEPSMTDTINEAKEKKDSADKKKADTTNYGNKDMSDVDMVNPYELKKGIRIEMVDIEDYEKAMDKAVKKLKKDPMFYSNLIANVKETKGKRSDVPTEVKDKKLNKVSDKLKDKANEMEVSKKDAAKKNANDSLNKKEKASGKPKGVKEMTMKPKASKGMKSMSVPGKEKKTNLKESFNLWELFKKNILR
jgi:hypothetical protein